MGFTPSNDLDEYLPSASFPALTAAAVLSDEGVLPPVLPQVCGIPVLAIFGTPPEQVLGRSDLAESPASASALAGHGPSTSGQQSELRVPEFVPKRLDLSA